MAPRLLFDLSTLARWAGPPVGIIRAERELARFARDHLEHAVFVLFDPLTDSYRQAIPRYVPSLIAGTVSMEPWSAPSATARKRRSDRIPPALRPAAQWVLQFRRSALLALERERLRPGTDSASRIAERLQQMLLTDKYRGYLFNPDGSRRNVLRREELAGPPVAFTADDVLVCAGAPWAHANVRTVAALKARHRFRLALLCYDFIPVLFPHYYKQDDARLFRDYYEAAFPIADLVVFNARVVEQDTIAACRRLGIPIGQSCVVPLGANLPPPVQRGAPLPDGLAPGRYALFVSTIEPRKGHRMLTDAWLRLLAGGIPQRHGFKLVFAGRPGWLMDDLIERLRSDAPLRETLHLLHDVPDETLHALYDGAAFCLYPSAYEGFGLPIVEAFLRGKAVLASTGGAIPEVAAGLAPCLDPDDAGAWQTMLARWISDPAVATAHAPEIRRRFRHVSWSEAAERFFAAVENAPRRAERRDVVEKAAVP